MIYKSAWAKLDEYKNALPLTDHGADTASILAYLMAVEPWRSCLNRLAGRPLTQLDHQRLGVLAYLHDLGKCNRGFWSRQFEGKPNIGHTNETAALFFCKTLQNTQQTQTLRTIIEHWDCYELFAAVMAHHGRPLRVYRKNDDNFDDVVEDVRKYCQYWKEDVQYNPLAELEILLNDIQQRFPSAFTDKETLPNNAEFVAFFGGLVTLCDWLASDTRLFPVAAPHYAERELLRQIDTPKAIQERGLEAISTPLATFQEAFGFSPSGAQQVSSRLDLGNIALIEAETGSGKTEAALWRWLALRRAGLVDGLYFALPTRSAAVQLHSRVQKMLQRVFGKGNLEAVQAVPGYLKAGEAEGQALPEFKVVWSDDNNNSNVRWAAEQPKRYLAARIAVGTIDQVLLAGLKVKHAHFRATMLSRSLLVVDEVHASDAFMGEVLQQVLCNHTAFGGHALLLSATLGAAARVRLLQGKNAAIPCLGKAINTPYPAICGTDLPEPDKTPSSSISKNVQITLLPLLDKAAKSAAQAIAAARQGASVLVVRNSVQGAIEVARLIEETALDLTFRINGQATLHHGRFAPDDRRLLDKAVEVSFGKNRTAEGRILVGTQTLEQSLDIDADLLITDLAPMDVLLQRIGRLHRHRRTDRGGYQNAQVLVLVPENRDLSRYLGKISPRHGLGAIDSSGTGVYPDMRIIEATWRMLEQNQHITIPKDNRRLVEGALHPDVLEKIRLELGGNWHNHAAQQGGKQYAEQNFAKNNTYSVTTPFRELLFPLADEKIATRLGVGGRTVFFEPPFTGVFGNTINQLSIPEWMLRGISSDAVPEKVQTTSEGIQFQLERQTFSYGRYGLEKQKAN